MASKISKFFTVCAISNKEMLSNDLLGKTSASSTDKAHAKSKILREIYGDKKGTFYEFGLAEATDEEDFKVKVSSLKEKWNSLCPSFHQWFEANRSQKFIESVITTAREGTDVSGIFYQNDIEAMHFVEKKSRISKGEHIQSHQRDHIFDETARNRRT